MDERLEIHLCNLHNEVFEAAESRINTECSLTIREGISRAREQIQEKQTFPHYTWGYIGFLRQQRGRPPVPSLYVRVYRTWKRWLGTLRSSLTIREGISLRSQGRPGISEFPHYTWGYIASFSLFVFPWKVPSLYVRVYRRWLLPENVHFCSLTIREGISFVFGYYIGF